ncbi:SBBP repeat-containing protein [Pontibacter sp. 172403-2]|uniref:Ig-like domain-containing protein n=1 Tax=Pontibacter rufus TaxID=2791028 RepID=UPI0018AF9C5D|nr:SBBP repeat-containing protein [Pontibacter sp. 172403-2]
MSCSRNRSQKPPRWLYLIGCSLILAILPRLTFAQATQKWVAVYNEQSAQQAYGRKVVTDVAGNIYVGGNRNSSTGNDFLLIKYNAAGEQQWKAVYDGGANDDLTDLKIDAAGNLYASGNSNNGTNGNDYVTVKYNTNGEQQWVARYNGTNTTNSYDNVTAMAVDAAGNVYVTGQSMSETSNNYDYATVKYNTNGEQQWVARYSGTNATNSYDYATAMAVDAAGNVYVTGQSMSETSNNYDYATVKYNTSGEQQWIARYSGTNATNSYDYATAMAVDAQGNVYVTGRSMSETSNNYDYATVKYNTNGEQQWVARYSGTNATNSYDYATAMAVDAAGNVYVTGQSMSATNNDYDYATVKYNTSGEQQWVARYGGNNTTNYNNDNARAVAVDAAGNVYVTGQSTSESNTTDEMMMYNNYDYATVKYNTIGEQQWVARYSGNNASDNSYDYAMAIAVDAAGNAIVTGQSYNGTKYEIATIKYSSSIATVISSSAPNLTNASPLPIAIDFARDVTGFTLSDVVAAGGTVANFSGSGSHYTLEVTPTADGEVTVNVAEGVAVDELEIENAQAQQFSIIYDHTAPVGPVIASISDDTGISNSDKATSDNTLMLAGTAEPNTTVTVSETTQGEVGATKADAAGNWAFDYQTVELPESTYTLTATATDAAGNTGNASAEFVITVDQTAPTVALQSDVAMQANAPFQLSAVFSEPVYTLTAASFEVQNAAVSDVASADGLTYTATVSPTADGPVSIKLPAVVVSDLAGNTNTVSNTIETTFDATRPSVAISSAASDIVKAPFNIQISFSEPVDGFEAADVTVENGSLKDLATEDHKLYTAVVEPTADGMVTINVAEDLAADAATNGNTASNILTRIYDVTLPTVVVATEATEKLNNSFDVSVTFSEGVTGFLAEDLTVTNARLSTYPQTDSKVYTFRLTPTADGEVSVAVPADVAQDLAANGNEASNKLVRLYDATRPAVTLTTSAPNPTNAAIPVTVEFSEPVSGLAVEGFAVTNGTAAGFEVVSDTKYTAVVTPAADGQVSIALAASAAADAATNGNTASNELQLVYDATAPAGYAIAFGPERVDVANQNATSASITGAETGTTYTYSITSENGGMPVTGTAVVQHAGFDLTALDLSGLNDGTLTATLYLTDAAGNKGGEATTQVLKVTRNIVAVATPAVINVPIRTTYANVPLPATVEVTYATGEKAQIGVTWSPGNYNGLIAGPYALTGELVLAPMTTNYEGHKAAVTVEVQPNKVPTALAFSATTFKPEAAADDVLGMLTTTDEDDNEFVYELASGQGDTNNNLFEVRGDEVYLKSNSGLSGMISFTIRVRSTDPYLNTIEKSFTLTKELYAKAEAQLKIVNAFSPDGDGINDTWTIPELRFYNHVEIEVYDRSGVRLFHTTKPEEGWNGKDTNGLVRQGGFLYIVQVKDINMVKKGVVTVLKK